MSDTAQPRAETIHKPGYPLHRNPAPSPGYDVYAFHTDNPRVVTRSTDQAIAWRWDTAEPFGATGPNQNPNSLGTSNLNQRLPGPLLDTETGNFYNWHRDYKPGLGRYAQSDPIGLGGGVNTYAYVDGRQVLLVDPSGLQAFQGSIFTGGVNSSYAQNALNPSIQTLGMDSTSGGWQAKSQLVVPIRWTPLDVDITATMKPGQPVNWYTGIRATGLSLMDTLEYSCKAGQIKGPTAKVSMAMGLGVGIAANGSVSSDGSSRMGVSFTVGMTGQANANGGVWGFSPPSPGTRRHRGIRLGRRDPILRIWSIRSEYPQGRGCKVA